MTRSRLLPALAALALTFVALLPSAWTAPQHGDETNYAWSGWYYVGLLCELDLRFTGPPWDPGWDPESYWAVTQPMGVSLLYGSVLHVTGLPVPQYPYNFAQPLDETTRVPLPTLRLLRTVAVFCAALGLALIVFRLGTPALIATALFLAIPHVRVDLARVTGDAPVLLGFGLCAAAYGSDWFAPMCGLAATFKLTALVLWPVAFFRGWGKSRYRHLAALLAAWVPWVILTPTSWPIGGFPMLAYMILNRVIEYYHQSTYQAGWLGEVLAQERVFGLFLPSRYLWPLELGVLLFLAHRGAKWIAARKARIP